MTRTRNRNRTQALVLCLALGAISGLLVACEPADVRPVFTVTTDASWEPDADPGDGVCATEAGACTVIAAVDEANAQGSGDIVLPHERYERRFDAPEVVITGDVRFPEGGVFQGFRFRVASGGRLEVNYFFRDDRRTEDRPLDFVVDGVLVVERSILANIDIHEGGRVLMLRSAMGLPDYGSLPPPSVRNAGTLTALYTAFFGKLETTPTGSTRLGASMAPRCTGALPVSLGYNGGDGQTCNFYRYTDLPFPTVVRLEGDYGYSAIVPTDPNTDHIPVGVMGCGVSHPVGSEPAVPAADDNKDGVAGCEPGPGQGPRWGF